MKSFTLEELAKLTGGKVIGDSQVKIDRVSPIEAAESGAITFLSNPKYSRFLESTKASAVIVPPEISDAEVTLLQVQNPYVAFAQVLANLNPVPRPAPGIHPGATVADDAQIGEDVYIGPKAVIGAGVKIGAKTCIYPGAYVGDNSQIGQECVINANVSIYQGVNIGDKVIIHSGTTIGSDGFGYVFANGKQQKVPQVGTVVIEDEVEIGANVTIDRGTMGATRICRYSKIDNLVQIAHNVVIGENSIVVGQAGISGSTKLGKRVILGGQVGVVGHLELADDTKVAAGAGVTKSTSPGTILAGFAGMPHQQWRKSEVAVRRLPKLQEKVRELEKRVNELIKNTDKTC